MPLSWDGQSWQVANVGNSRIALLAENGSVVELAQTTVESLVKEGRISQLPTVSESEGRQKLSDDGYRRLLLSAVLSCLRSLESGIR
jgi:ribosomal protein L19E